MRKIIAIELAIITIGLGLELIFLVLGIWLNPFYPNGKYGITGRQRLKYRKLARKGRTGI